MEEGGIEGFDFSPITLTLGNRLLERNIYPTSVLLLLLKYDFWNIVVNVFGKFLR